MVTTSAPTQAASIRGRRRIPGSTLRDEDPDRHRQQERQRVVADREPEDHGGRHEPLGRPRAAPSVLERDCSQRTSRTSSSATRARCSVCGSAWVASRHVDGARATPTPAAIAISVRPPQPRNEVRGEARRGRDAEQRQDVHPEGRLAERRQEEVHDPAKEHVRRVARRVGRAHDRQDRLELAGVPVADVRQEAGPDDDQHEERDGDGPARAPRRSMTFCRRSGDAITIRGGSPTSCPRS